MARRVRSQAGRAALIGLAAGVAILLAGAIRHELTVTWWVAAGVVALLLTALVWLALEPNPPHHPDAPREDRGFNYVRGEGGGGT